MVTTNTLVMMNLISRAREEAENIRVAASKEGYEAGIQSASEDIAQVRETLNTFLSAAH